MKITICGSASFVKHMAEAQAYLTNKGFEVFTPEPLMTEDLYKEKYGKEELYKMKPLWTKKHWGKIENSDAILILNKEKKGINGYFGSNTLMELSVAYYLGKKIFLLHAVQENHPHYEETIGLEAIVLGGDLDKIQK